MKQTIKPLRFETYCAMIEDSVGTRMFKRGYALVNGKQVNVMKDGVISCGWHTSAILSLFGYIKSSHATIDSTIRDLEASGWKKVKRPRKGAILLWEAKVIRGASNRHLGFYLDTKRAVSNDYKTGTPRFNHPTYGMKGGKPVRKLEAIYWKEGLEKT